MDESGGCIHGGELRTSSLPSGFNNCTNISASDSLGVFNWICDPNSGAPRVISNGFKTGKGLKDLITTAGFRNETLSILQGNLQIGLSSASVWWSNPVSVLADNSAGVSLSVNTSGTIYVVDSSRVTPGYVLNGDKTSLVVLPGFTLGWSGAASGSSDCRSVKTPACLIAHYQWVEGNFDGFTTGTSDDNNFTIRFFGRAHNVNSTRGSVGGFAYDDYQKITASNFYANTDKGFVPYTYSNYQTISDSNFYNNGDVGLRVYASYLALNNVMAYGNSGAGISTSGTNGTFDHLIAFKNGDVGMNVNNTFGIMRNLSAFQNTNTGVVLYTISSAIVSDVKTIGNGGDGVISYYGDNAILTNVMTASNQGAGLSDYSYGSGTAGFTVSHLTSMHNLGNGGRGTDKSTWNQVLLTANGGLGFEVRGNDNRLSQMAISSNQNGGIYTNTYGVTGTDIKNNMIVSSNLGSDCMIYGTASGAGFDNTCNNQGTSAATWFSSLATLTNSIVGKISSDSANANGATGTSTYSSITDWSQFTNFLRGWGLDAAPSSSYTYEVGPCASGLCRIWDYSLKTADSLIRNTSASVITPNTVFIVGSACPSAVNGTTTVTDNASPPRTFLANAVELVNDPTRNPTGNNNGVCETGEGCVYSPNFGAYQGHGALTSSTCIFNSGTVTGVSMYNFTTNGY